MAENKITPAYDNKIYQKYSKKTIENKEKNKIAFLQDLERPFHKKIPLICVTYALTDQNQVSLIQAAIEGILEQPVEVVFTAVGSPKYQGFFSDLASQQPEKVAIADGDADSRRKIYAAADIMLVSSNSPECLSEAKNGLAYGAVPVMPPADFAEDYNLNLERGNAFVYPRMSHWSLYAALIRALENFKFPYDWKTIQVAGMSESETEKSA